MSIRLSVMFLKLYSTSIILFLRLWVSESKSFTLSKISFNIEVSTIPSDLNIPLELIFYVLLDLISAFSLSSISLRSVKLTFVWISFSWRPLFSSRGFNQSYNFWMSWMLPSKSWISTNDSQISCQNFYKTVSESYEVCSYPFFDFSLKYMILSWTSLRPASTSLIFFYIAA